MYTNAEHDCFALQIQRFKRKGSRMLEKKMFQSVAFILLSRHDFIELNYRSDKPPRIHCKAYLFTTKFSSVVNAVGVDFGRQCFVQFVLPFALPRFQSQYSVNINFIISARHLSLEAGWLIGYFSRMGQHL